MIETRCGVQLSCAKPPGSFERWMYAQRSSMRVVRRHCPEIGTVSTPKVLAPWLRKTLLLQPVPQVFDKSIQITIVWCQAGEVLSIFEGCTDVARVTVECYKGKQGVAIIRMPGDAVL